MFNPFITKECYNFAFDDGFFTAVGHEPASTGFDAEVREICAETALAIDALDIDTPIPSLMLAANYKTFAAGFVASVMRKW